MPGSDPLRWDAPTIAAAVQSRRADPVETTNAFLDQIQRASPAVNALVDHDEAAPRAEAAGLRRRVAAGETLPLAGVLVAVKDSIWVAGRRITQGSPLFRDFRPVRDALPVERTRRAGAVVIGIGNMPEFGAKEITDNRLYGRTLNPPSTRLRFTSFTPSASSTRVRSCPTSKPMRTRVSAGKVTPTELPCRRRVTLDMNGSILQDVRLGRAGALSSIQAVTQRARRRCLPGAMKAGLGPWRR